MPGPVRTLTLVLPVCVRAQRLLGDIEEDVDRGQRGLKKETKHAKTVAREAKVGWMYGVICLLIIILVVVIVTGSKRKS